MTAPLGITTTVPVEVLLAAGRRPIDLNNIFISDPHPERLVRLAERQGFPLNTCTWIKGIFGVCVEQNIEQVLGVTTGDCSNTLMLLEVLKLRGVKTMSFAYPEKPSSLKMKQALTRLAEQLGTTIMAAEKILDELKPVRGMIHELDRLTWQENRFNGWENHYWLVSSSDFNGSVANYETELRQVISSCQKREPFPERLLRLAYCGVPAVFGREMYPYLEKNGGRVVFNEVQRQFAMPVSSVGLNGQYASYTYPYSIQGRIEDIADECEKRRVDGIIHYTQAFCHRAIGDIIFRHALKYPILTLEGNLEFGLTQHLKTRLEAFLDMVRQGKTGQSTE